MMALSCCGWEEKRVSLAAGCHPRAATPGPDTHRHEQLGCVTEVAQEDHDVHALGQARDLAEADHELVLVRELLQRLLLPLKLPNERLLVLGGQEAQQQLQKVKAQGLLVIPAGGGKPPAQSDPAAGPSTPQSPVSASHIPPSLRI